MVRREVAVPAKQRRRRDDQPSPPVAAHESGEPREQGSVGVAQARRLRGAPVDGELVTKDRELRFASPSNRFPMRNPSFDTRRPPSGLAADRMLSRRLSRTRNLVHLQFE
jgi:hypothetical protein